MFDNCPACPAHHPVRDVLGKELEIRVWSKVWPPCSHIGCVGLDSYAQRNLNFSRGSVLGSVESIILFLADHILSLSTSPHLTSNLPQPPSWQLWYVCFWVSGWFWLWHWMLNVEDDCKINMTWGNTLSRCQLIPQRPLPTHGSKPAHLFQWPVLTRMEFHLPYRWQL